jgi:hypothetical protein
MAEISEEKQPRNWKTTRFTKVIRITIEHSNYVDKIKKKKSRAGMLEEIINEHIKKKNKHSNQVATIEHSNYVEPKQYGNPEINQCIEFLKSSLGGSLDGTIQKNRIFAKHLMGKMKKDYPDKEPVEQIKALITFGRKDNFHGKNMTSFEYIYKNKQKIIEAVRGQKQQVRNLVINDPNV